MQGDGELVPGQAPETLDAMRVIGLDVDDLPALDWTLEKLAEIQGRTDEA